MHKFNIAMKFEEAIQKIQYGKCLLLTGAGFSLGAKNYKQDKSAFRIAKYIAHELYNECDVPKENQDDDLRRASQWYIRQYGEDKIIAFLQREFIIKEISPTQKELGNFPWRRCYTLNYDEILERAYLENNKLLSSVTLSDESEQYRTSSVCVHLNGVISQLSRATIDNSFKLTYKSYNKDYIKNTGWWEIFEDDLLLCDAIFFVGCSLQSDTDLIHLLDRTKNIKEKTFFIVGPDENDIDLMQLEDLGTPLKLGTEGFVRELQNVPIINVDIPYTFHHFVTPRIINQKPERKRISFIDLLVKGNVDENLLAYSIKNADSFPYFVFRDKLEVVLQKIQSGCPFIVVLSDLGNGKTLFLKALSICLLEKGKKVFYLERDALSAIDELDYICNQTDDPTVIIIENYADTVNLLKKIGRYKHNHISLVLSERTPAHETAHLFLRDIMLDDPFEIDLNELTDKEVESLIQVVEKNGLWQKRSHFTVDEKIQFIKTRCKRHLSQFIIQLVKSDDLGNRYNEIVTAIKHRSDYYQALLYLLIGAVLDFRLRLVDIVDDLGLDSLNNISFRKNKFLREFIDFDTEEIVFKSSVLSNYILKNLLNYSDIDTPLIQIYERLHEKRSHKRIRKYLKEIMLYQNLNRILKKDSDQRGLNRAIFNIYEKVAYLEYNRENPLFWLQFAIARLADGEYSDAARCFDNAYSYAKNTNFDTFQIDNHFARYLLEDANEKKNVIEPIEVFKRAHRMLMASQKGNQYKHYSFRVARHYSTFYSIYHKDFSFHERYDFFIACHEMLDAVEKYLALPGASKKDMVEETRKQLEELLINEN